MQWLWLLYWIPFFACVPYFGLMLYRMEAAENGEDDDYALAGLAVVAGIAASLFWPILLIPALLNTGRRREKMYRLKQERMAAQREDDAYKLQRQIREHERERKARFEQTELESKAWWYAFSLLEGQPPGAPSTFGPLINEARRQGWIEGEYRKYGPGLTGCGKCGVEIPVKGNGLCAGCDCIGQLDEYAERHWSRGGYVRKEGGDLPQVSGRSATLVGKCVACGLEIVKASEAPALCRSCNRIASRIRKQ